MVKMKVDPALCKGCAICVSVCPLKLLELDPTTTNDAGYHVMHNTDMNKCVGCGSCAIMCPDAAITLTKED